ncbi:hypothetical protein [Halorussus salinisoli]|nr:hypothetical protein [Halorussus salinisoli]
MPVVPHYPSDESNRERDAPDFGEIVDEILERDDPSPTPVA